MKDVGLGKLAAAAPEFKRQIPLATKPAAEMSSKVQQQQPWNTKNLGLRYGTDLVSAASAASMVAPLISVVDRSIMENASGRNTLAGSLKESFQSFLVRPHLFLFSKPVALIFMLYGGTYLTANALDTTTATVRNKPATHVTAGTTKFAASSATNIGICIYKDSLYVKMFGPGGPPRPVPLPSLALFAVRDCLTIFASFNVPPLLGPILNARLGKEFQKAVSGETVAQFLAPAAVQFASTPLHLLGLDLYNRPKDSAGGVSWKDRAVQVRKNWIMSSLARVCRIVPAFGVGGVVNVKVRKTLMDKLA